MRNTYTLSRLGQRIRQALPRPLSAAGEAALAGFFSLAGISRWQPARIGVLELSFVFDIGVPLGLIGDEPTIAPLAAAVGDAVAEGHRPDPALWRVVHAAALLRHWGLVVAFAGDRIRLRLADEATLDVHVGTVDAAGALDVDAPRLRMVDVSGDSGAHGAIAAACDEVFAASPRLAGVVTFEPRFWVSVERKEWIYRVRVSENADVPIGVQPFDRRDSGRRVLRVELLESAVPGHR